MLVDTVAAPLATLSARYRWHTVSSAQPYAAVLMPGGAAPRITVNRWCVSTQAEFDRVARWADSCLSLGWTAAFLSAADLQAAL